MRTRASLLLMALSLALPACATPERSEVAPPTTPPLPEEAAPESAQEPAAKGPSPNVEFAVMTQPMPDPMPSVRIAAPKADEVIPVDKAASFEVKLDVKDWPVQEDGPHVHLILDNQPYMKVHDPAAKIELRAIAPGATLAEGQHVLVAFPSTSEHISIKPERGKNPSMVVPFWIGKKGVATWKPTDPTLVYSRPKGEYTGADADEVILDFYLLNAELGPGKYTVHPTVTASTGRSQSITVTTWQPFRLLNLPDGPAVVKLELRDKDGMVVPGPWNSVERTIIVRRGMPQARAH